MTPTPDRSPKPAVRRTLRASALGALVGAVLLCCLSLAAANEPELGLQPNKEERLTLMFGPYVHHYDYDPNHIDTPWLTGLEWGPQGSWLDYGAAFFRNSFNQPSVYVYAGKRWFVRDEPQGAYLKLTAGPLYGYRGQYEDKVPFNHGGLALAIIPGLGYQYHAFNAQVVLLGTAAWLLTFGYDLPR